MSTTGQGQFDSESGVFTTSNGVFNKSRGLGIVSVRLLQQRKEWQGITMAGAPWDAWTKPTDLSVGSSWPLTTAFRWNYRKRYLNASIRYTTDWPEPGSPIYDDNTASIAFSGPGLFPSVTGIFGRGLRVGTPCYLDKAAYDVVIYPDGVDTVDKFQPMGFYPVLTLEGSAGATTFTEGGTWTNYTGTRQIASWPTPGDAAITDTITIALSGENVYTGPLATATDRITSAARSLQWSAAPWCDCHTGMAALEEHWAEFGPDYNISQAAATGALVTATARAPYVIAGANGAPFTYPEFLAEYSPLLNLGPGLYQLDQLHALCSWWMIMSGEEIPNMGFHSSFMEPVLCQRAQFRVDKTTGYWMAKAKIRRMADPGTTGETWPTAVGDITLIETGTLAANRVKEIPMPTKPPGGYAFSTIGSGDNALLTQGEVVFCILGISVEDWEAATGLTVST